MKLIMPKLEPVIMPTKGLSFWPTLWALLTSVRRWRLTEDWRYLLPVDNGVLIVIPKGFEFDGASIPKPLYFLAGAFLLLLFIGVEISAVLMLILAALFMISGLLLSPVGIMLIAGIVHDFAYSYGYLWRLLDNGTVVKFRYRGGSRLAWDDLFFKINLHVNGAIYADWLAAFLLKLFGGVAWRNARNSHYREIIPDS